MEPLATAAVWLASEAGKQLYTENLKFLFASMGLVFEKQEQVEMWLRQELHETSVLLDEYMTQLNSDIKQIKNVLEENRLAELYTGFQLLVDASPMDNRQAFLAQALSSFYKTSSLPVNGVTGQFQNRQLRALAFLGIACTFSLLAEPPDTIAGNIVSAVDADPLLSEQFLGKGNTRAIAHRLGILFRYGDTVRVKETASLESVKFLYFYIKSSEGSTQDLSSPVSEDFYKTNKQVVRDADLQVHSSSYKTTRVEKTARTPLGFRWPGYPVMGDLATVYEINTSCLYPVRKQAAQARQKQQATTVNQLQQAVDDLSSKRFGANYYAKLRDLLAAKEWKAADLETEDRMSELMDLQYKGGIAPKHIREFPCLDLRNIKSLWVKYSKGLFGFSVQKEIWQIYGSPTEYSDSAWKAFCEAVGWCKNERYLHYPDFTYDLTAKRGHLPSPLSGIVCAKGGSYEWEVIPSLASRLVDCSIAITS